MIPKIIHQTYKTDNLPPYYRREWQQSWKDHHPDWEYRFWTDADLRALAAEKYPWCLPVFDRPEVWPGVIRADLGRLMVLDQFGGVYADLDYVNLRPLDPLLTHDRTFIAARSPASGIPCVPNAFIASMPGQPIIRDVLANGVPFVQRGEPDIRNSFGWGAFSGVVRMHRDDAGVYVSPPAELCPLSWMPEHYMMVDAHRRLQLSELRTLYPQSHAMTFWETGWGSKRRARIDAAEKLPLVMPVEPPTPARSPQERRRELLDQAMYGGAPERKGGCGGCGKKAVQRRT